VQPKYVCQLQDLRNAFLGTYGLALIVKDRRLFCVDSNQDKLDGP
jgi:hypothetical protein